MAIPGPNDPEPMPPPTPAGSQLLDAIDVVRIRAALTLPGLLVVGVALMVGSFERPPPGLIST